MDFQQVEERERDLLQLKQPGERASALCLSGGGIRSATFCLGVLQALSRREKLGQYHYLSTVSGGGYIGSWFMRRLADLRIGTPDANPVSQLQAELSAGEEPESIRNLRAYSNYLSPVWGLSTDFFTVVGIYLRNLLLNWTVLWPLLFALMLAPFAYHGLVLNTGTAPSWLAYCLGLFALAPIVWPTHRRRSKSAAENEPNRATVDDIASPIAILRSRLGRQAGWLPVAAAIVLDVLYRGSDFKDAPEPIWVAAVFAAITLVTIARFGRDGSRSPRAIPAGNRRVILTVFGWLSAGAAFASLAWFILAHGDKTPLSTVIGVPFLLAAVAIAQILYAAITRRVVDEASRETQARYASYWLRFALGWIVLFTIAAYAPRLIALLFDSSNLALPLAGAGVWGMLIGAAGYLSRNHQNLTRRAKEIGATLGRLALDLAALAFILVLLGGLAWAGDRLFGTFRVTSPEASLAKAVKNYSDRLVIVEVESLVPLRTEKLETALANAETTAMAVADTATRLGSHRPERQVAVDRIAPLLERTSSVHKTLHDAGRSGSNLAEIEKSTAGSSSLKQALTTLLDDPKTAKSIFSCNDPPENPCWPATENPWAPVVGLVVTAAVAAIASFFVGINTFSMHSLYGNRLARAYLGSARNERNSDGFTGFDEADNIAMHELADGSGSREAGERWPLHVINLTLNLVKATGNRLEWQQRKAAPFTVSPLHAGSELVGYQDSKRYASSNGISLARAMTISGAAASPNMGYHSSPAVSFVMTFFNVRLGWWLPNPKFSDDKLLQKREPESALKPLFFEATGQTTEERDWIYLSDGGHFDNLGLYEMIRRRCRKIVVVDASADPQRRHEDLFETMRRIRVDFGVTIDFGQSDWSVPHRCRIAEVDYPANAPGDAFTGELIYLKPTLCGDEPPDVLAYAQASAKRKPNNPFPHQSTADQFFDEQQFESYRMLGELTVDRCLRDSAKAREQGKRDKEDGEWVSEPCPSWQTESSRVNQSDDAGAHTGAGLGQAIRHLASPEGGIGPAAMLGAALVVGGTIGVTGTVALRDNVVRLDERAAIRIEQASLDALEKTPVKLSPPEKIPVEVTVKSAPPGDPPSTVTVDPTILEALQKLVAQLSGAIATGANQQRLQETIAQLNSRIAELQGESIREARNLADQLQALAMRVDDVNLKAELGKLGEQIRTEIENLESTIQDLPRPAVGATPR